MSSKEFRQALTKKALKHVFDPERIAHIHGPIWRRVIYNWEKALERLLPLGGSSDGNLVSTFIDGDKAFFAMRDAIDNASKSVWLETYIFEPDKLGRFVRDSLIRAAKRGCEVILLFDHFGSGRMSKAFLEPLRQSGATALAFNPIWPWRKKGPLLFRDHRKILVVDNQIGFCGGINISEDYGGLKLGNARFRDTLVRIDGPAVFYLGKYFWGSFRETTGIDRENPFEGQSHEEGKFAQVLGSNTRRNLRAIQNSMEVTLHRATRFCYLTSPYFLPYQPLKKAMIEAAQRGVDVRVLSAGLSDVPLMRKASQHVYGQFLKSGIRIYEMFNKNLHAKTAVIDGVYGSIGSFNLDHWSARRNLEVNVSILDRKTAKDLQNHFFDDLTISKEVTLESLKKRSFWARIMHWVAYQLMRL